MWYKKDDSEGECVFVAIACSLSGAFESEIPIQIQQSVATVRRRQKEVHLLHEATQKRD